MKETTPSATLIYLNTSACSEPNTLSEQIIIDNILANNKLNNNFNILKNIKNYKETEIQNYNKKLNKNKDYKKRTEVT